MDNPHVVKHMYLETLTQRYSKDLQKKYLKNFFDPYQARIPTG